MVYEEGVEAVVVGLSKSLEGTGVVGFEGRVVGGWGVVDRCGRGCVGEEGVGEKKLRMSCVWVGETMGSLVVRGERGEVERGRGTVWGRGRCVGEGGHEIEDLCRLDGAGHGGIGG